MSRYVILIFAGLGILEDWPLYGEHVPVVAEICVVGPPASSASHKYIAVQSEHGFCTNDLANIHSKVTDARVQTAQL